MNLFRRFRFLGWQGLLLTTLFVLGRPLSGATQAGDKDDSLRILGGLVEKYKITNNPLSVKYAYRALELARAGTSDSTLVNAYKWVGKSYFQNHKDSSYYYFNLALKLAASKGLNEQKIHIFYNLASLNSAAYDYNTALSLLDSSIVLAERFGDQGGIANGYIAMGNIKYNTHDYDNARLLFDSALNISKRYTLYKQMGVSLGNLARKPYEQDIHRLMSMQKEALYYLKKVDGVEEEMAYILINMGNQSSNPDSALFYYKTALDLAVKANLPKVLFGAYNNIAYSYLDKGNIKAAEECLRDYAIPIALEKKDNDWLASLYDTYADVCVRKGDYKRGLEFQKKAMRARNDDYRQKGSEQVHLLAALLELKNKELIIQNEEKELLLQSNRLQRLELYLVIAVLIAGGLFFLLFLLQQRNRARLQREQISSAKRIIEMEETEKGRTARELHDLTGHLVLSISGIIENTDFPDPAKREQISEQIREVSTSMRKISHRMSRKMIEHFTFAEMIEGHCEDLKKLSGLKIDLEMDEEFPDLSSDMVNHFYRILQELLTNAGKYARDSQIVVRVHAEPDRIMLSYSDDGPGFEISDKKKPSMGVMNIYERAKIVGGEARLSTAPGKGTRWDIVFPLVRKKQTAS